MYREDAVYTTLDERISSSNKRSLMCSKRYLFTSVGSPIRPDW